MKCATMSCPGMEVDHDKRPPQERYYSKEILVMMKSYMAVRN